MPAAVRSTKERAMSSSVGNSLRGNTPARATISQIAPTTTNGNALRATAANRSLRTAGAAPSVAASSIVPVFSLTFSGNLAAFRRCAAVGFCQPLKHGQCAFLSGHKRRAGLPASHFHDSGADATERVYGVPQAFAVAAKVDGEC